MHFDIIARATLLSQLNVVQKRTSNVNKGSMQCCPVCVTACSMTADQTTREDKKPLRKAKTPQGKFDTDEKDTKTTDAFKSRPLTHRYKYLYAFTLNPAARHRRNKTRAAQREVILC